MTAEYIQHKLTGSQINELQMKIDNNNRLSKDFYAFLDKYEYFGGEELSMAFETQIEENSKEIKDFIKHATK